ncbi:MAG: hypothetical protein ACTH6O_03655 [Vibrio toranzoniae]
MFLSVNSLFLTACTTLDEQQRLTSQNKIYEKKHALITKLITKNPDIAADLDESIGYMLCESERMMLLAVGGQSGLCLLIDNQLKQQTVLDLNSINLGVGLGASHKQILITFADSQALNKVKNGHFAVQLQGVSETEQTTPVATSNYTHKVNLYSLNNEGSIASLGVGAISLTLNKQLNDPDFAIGNMPMKTNKVPTKNSSQPTWPYALPFLADKVLAKGYQLPKPYGVGFTYVNIKSRCR